MASLFIAIEGKQHDGHDYLRTLYQNGYRNFLVEKQVELTSLPEANVVKVADGTRALQQIAYHHRNLYDYPIIAITGSNGKTTIKEWLFQMLWQDYPIVRSPKSYNSQIGVPLSVLQMRLHHELGIFEAGISEPGEMQNLATLLRPKFGLFTNLGSAHDEGFSNRIQKASEKLKLFEHCDWFVYPSYYEDLSVAIEESNLSQKAISWGKAAGSRYQILSMLDHDAGTSIRLSSDSDVNSFLIPFRDAAAIENLCGCIAFLLKFGMKAETIKERLLLLEPVNMRLELKEGINNCQLIDDAYNSDLRSLEIALDFLDQQHQQEKKILVISDILQSGTTDTKLYAEVSALLQERDLAEIYTIGAASSTGLQQLASTTKFSSFESTVHFLKEQPYLSWSKATILFKGARSFQFEQIIERISLKAHQTRLEINLNAIAHNLSLYRSHLKPGVKIMAMIKSAAYGSGSTEIAKTLKFHKADYLAVAYPDEGIKIRKAGIELPIMVMNSYEGSFASMIEQRLEPEIFSLEQLKAFLSVLRVSRRPSPYPIHVKLETGMNRLGFGESDLHELLQICQTSQDLIKMASLLSHLSAADDPNENSFGEAQIQKFEILSQKISEGLQIQPIRHILNSAGIVRFPKAHFDMVRLGIGLYGVDPTGLLQDQLHTVATLKSFVSQVRNVAPNESIGYGRSGQSGNKERRIATIAIGYADGYFRSLGNGKAHVMIHGHPAPTIGNICMDMCMVDVTEIPEVKPGDEVLIFGEQPTVSEVANWAGTISYELMTSISDRVKRVFYLE